ncbi:hypothetical protein KC19_5G135700 [Ceratodon purpureus]|uniref:Uncharacterized protein n=1 Tax=Ceratodon purpureus TaxID=3225 RepID=A0A8T0I2K4_CERPU|nr:hypothetical protein KC19_5G135700 [Ceratodon purpureus]KAG0577165.1 hypothetical protein KC19_5G135700 [Ceratodon purpureus]
MSSRPGWSSSSFNASRSMASSRSVSSRSGSYTISRGLTTLALDALKLALDGAEIKQEGDHFVHLQSELGDRRFRKLCEDADLALTEIHYCQEGLDIARINARGDQRLDQTVSQAQVEEMRQMKDLINHDYLILKLQPGEPNTEPLHIMAHKLRGGIHITHIPSSDISTIFHEGVRCFTVDCHRGEPKRIRLWELIAMLKLEDPDYSLRNANCWDYAKNTAKRLVRGCAQVGNISASEKTRLQKEHDTLEANLAVRHMHNIAKSLIRRISSGSRASNPSSLAPKLSSSLSTPSALDSVSNPSRASNLASLPSTSAASDHLVSNPSSLASKIASLSTPAALDSVSNSSSLASKLASPSTPAASDLVSNPSSLASKFASLSTLAALDLVSNPSSLASKFASPSTPAALDSVSNSSSLASKLASPSTAAALDLVSNSARFLDSEPAAEVSSTQAADLVLSEVLRSDQLVMNSSTVQEISSARDQPAINHARDHQAAASAGPVMGTGRICLQIVFLVFWLILNHLGLGPWAWSLLGSTGA